MTNQDYQLLSQYLDGELSASTAQELRLRLIAEPELRASLEHLQKVNNRVKSAFDIPGADAVPARIVQMVENAETRSGQKFRQGRAGWAMAIAASLVAAIGLLLIPDPGQQSGDNIVDLASQDALLAHVLEHSPSRGAGWDVLADGRRVRPLLSFPHAQGSWCREYLMSRENNHWRGVACRSDGRWLTAVHSTEDVTSSTDEYRPAGSSESSEVATFIATHSADIALSQSEEADLIARRWQ